MENFSKTLLENRLYNNQFLNEVYNRTQLLPFKAENGNQLISVDMKYSTKQFIEKCEEFFLNNNKLKLHIMGYQYILEVLNRGNFLDAYYN